MDIIESNENLARFLFRKKWIRLNNSVKHNAFAPPKDLRLSFTRHTNISEYDIWTIGFNVGRKGNRSIVRRADVVAVNVRKIELEIESSPVEDNDNHADIINWPESKDERMSKAMEIASASMYVEVP